jgi:hypothetical protein
MKSINYALLVALSSFMLTACGGGGSVSGPVNEASADDVAVQLELPTSSSDTEITDIIGDNSSSDYRKADWIPKDNANASNQKLSSYSSKLSSTDIISNKIISNGDSTSDWYVYDTSPDNASINSGYDDTRGSNVVCLSGDGINNGYALGWTAKDWSDNSTNKINDRVNKTIKWSMKFDEDYIVYVRLSTKKGYRYLYYTAANKNYGVAAYDAPHYIHNGLGVASKDGTWRTFTRNLSADLKRFDQSNEIISVDGFFVRGSGCIDDVELLKTNCDVANEVIYEDAEDGKKSRWEIYTNNDGSIANVSDSDKSSKVIEFQGDGVNTGYILGTSFNSWNNTTNKEISWDMKYGKNYVIYLSVLTTDGHRFITYSPMSDITCSTRGEGYGQGKKVVGDYTYIHTYLCPDSKNGTWKTITRNLEADLKKYEPNNSLVSVGSFLIRGSGRVDNIKMFDANADCDYDNSTN